MAVQSRSASDGVRGALRVDDSELLASPCAASGELDVCVLARNTTIADLKLGEVRLEAYAVERGHDPD
jgi:hypothetical protein